MEPNYISYLFLVVVFVVVYLFIDYFLLSKNLREINNRISKDPNYLNSPKQRELSQRMLNSIYITGPFMLIECIKLQKSLNKYK